MNNSTSLFRVFTAALILRSYAAWAWGSPDIVPMFTKNVKHASAFVYPSHLEDFYSLDAAELDRWVFKKVEVS